MTIIFLVGDSEKFVSAGFMRKYIHIARALKVRADLVAVLVLVSSSPVWLL